MPTWNTAVVVRVLDMAMGKHAKELAAARPMREHAQQGSQRTQLQHATGGHSHGSAWRGTWLQQGSAGQGCRAACGDSAMANCMRNVAVVMLMVTLPWQDVCEGHRWGKAHRDTATTRCVRAVARCTQCPWGHSHPRAHARGTAAVMPTGKKPWRGTRWMRPWQGGHGCGDAQADRATARGCPEGRSG